MLGSTFQLQTFEATWMMMVQGCLHIICWQRVPPPYPTSLHLQSNAFLAVRMGFDYIPQ
jgi:hypothetical protein